MTEKMNKTKIPEAAGGAVTRKAGKAGFWGAAVKITFAAALVAYLLAYIALFAIILLSQNALSAKLTDFAASTRGILLTAVLPAVVILIFLLAAVILGKYNKNREADAAPSFTARVEVSAAQTVNIHAETAPAQTVNTYAEAVSGQTVNNHTEAAPARTFAAHAETAPCQSAVTTAAGGGTAENLSGGVLITMGYKGLDGLQNIPDGNGGASYYFKIGNYFTDVKADRLIETNLFEDKSGAVTQPDAYNVLEKIRMADEAVLSYAKRFNAARGPGCPSFISESTPLAGIKGETGEGRAAAEKLPDNASVEDGVTCGHEGAGGNGYGGNGGSCYTGDGTPGPSVPLLQLLKDTPPGQDLGNLRIIAVNPDREIDTEEIFNAIEILKSKRRVTAKMIMKPAVKLEKIRNTKNYKNDAEFQSRTKEALNWCYKKMGGIEYQ